MPRTTRTTVFQLQPYQWFLCFWLVLNLVQISLTELTSDEGYYWFYASKLQWGYYDHPPMVAALVRMGTWLLPGEAGVRVMNLLMMTGAVFLFFRMVNDQVRNSRVTFLLLLAAPLANYLTFIIFPDGALLFFTMLFLYCYRTFLRQQTVATALLLGFSMAGMLYSKYHGVLVIFFALLAYPGILLSRKYWVAAAVGLVLFLPHLIWQVHNHFPTFQFHLSGRADAFSFDLALQYISQQVGAIGPGFLIVLFAIRVKDDFERVLLFIIMGTFAFFLVNSFRTFVHFHWTSIAVFPVLYFASGYYHQQRRRKLFNWLIVPFVLLLFIARVLLAIDIGVSRASEDFYHGRKEWAKEISGITGNVPVLFPNNLREAPLYSFYSGNPGIALYDRPEKKSQYELWHYEDSLQGKEVAIVTKYPMAGARGYHTSMGETIYINTSSPFRSFFTGIEIATQPVGDHSDSLQLTIRNVRQSAVPFTTTDSLVYNITEERHVIATAAVTAMPEVSLHPRQTITFTVAMPQKELHGKRELFFGIRSKGLPDSYNSAAITGGH